MRKVEEIFGEVSNEFGKVLPLKIRKDAPSAYFDWNSVTIPERFLEWEEDMLKNVMRHEFGHLFFSPRDPDVGVIMYYIASIAGYPDPWMFVNIVTDLIVDTTNMELFGGEYLKFLEWSFQRMKDPCPVFSIMEGVYREKAKELGMGTSLKENNKGKIVYSILSSKEIDFYRRVAEVAEILREPYKKCSMPRHFIIYIFSKKVGAGEIAKTLIRNGLNPGEIGRVDFWDGFGAGEDDILVVENDPVLIEYNRMRLIVKYMELKNDFGSEERMQREINQWKLGDPVERLDVVSTITNYGRILPGIFSLKNDYVKMGNDNGGKRYKDSIIVLDCSGSMSGEKFERAREAAYVITKRTYEDGGKIGFIPFTGGIRERYVVEPTRNFWRVSDILLRLMPTGGTVISPALRRAILMGRDYHIYMLSDADVYDMDDARDILSKISGRSTFFLISEDGDPEGEWFMLDGVKIIKITPDGLVKKVYGEVRG